MHQQPGSGGFAPWALGTSDGYPGFSRSSALAVVCPPAERGVLLLHPALPAGSAPGLGPGPLAGPDRFPVLGVATDGWGRCGGEHRAAPFCGSAVL